MEHRDLSSDWNIDLNGIYAPRGYSFADLGYPGGPAPEETVVIRVFASGEGDDVAFVSIDPWTAEVEAFGIG